MLETALDVVVDDVELLELEEAELDDELELGLELADGLELVVPPPPRHPLATTEKRTKNTIKTAALLLFTGFTRSLFMHIRVLNILLLALYNRQRFLFYSHVNLSEVLAWQRLIKSAFQSPLMNWEQWRPFYLRIVREMGYSVEKDREASHLLRALLLESDEYILREELSAVIGKKAYVFGAGPSLEVALKEFDFLDGTLIAADGATSALLEKGIAPDVIVTDLDGRVPDLKIANEGGAFMVIHAHGDNVNKLKAYVQLFSRILGTCQTEPLDIVYNFGGFTDGDRAAFLAEALGAREITLVGFDFGETVGKWSKPFLKDHSPAWESKRKKFAFARELLEWLEKNGRARLVYASP